MPHKLVIHYIFIDTGEELFKDYIDEELWPNTPFEVQSPVHPDYYFDKEVITGWMENQDLEFVVFYYPKDIPNKHLVPFEDYETPLGVGYVQMHVGVCFE